MGFHELATESGHRAQEVELTEKIKAEKTSTECSDHEQIATELRGEPEDEQEPPKTLPPCFGRPIENFVKCFMECDKLRACLFKEAIR